MTDPGLTHEELLEDGPHIDYADKWVSEAPPHFDGSQDHVVIVREYPDRPGWFDVPGFSYFASFFAVFVNRLRRTR